MFSVMQLDGMTHWDEIEQNVRKWCLTSPDLFNLYVSEVIVTVLNYFTEGIVSSGRRNNKLRYLGLRRNY